MIPKNPGISQKDTQKSRSTLKKYPKQWHIPVSRPPESTPWGSPTLIQLTVVNRAVSSKGPVQQSCLFFVCLKFFVHVYAIRNMGNQIGLILFGLETGYF